MGEVFTRVASLHRVATLRDIHFIGPNTALLYSDFQTSGLPAPAGAPAGADASQPGFYDWVVTREHGSWQISLWHEADLVRRPAGPPAAAPAR